MTVRPDMQPLADRLREPAPHAVPISHDVFTRCKAIADSDGVSVRVVINEGLREWLGDR